MGGEADVSSELGVGSTFWFTACLGRGHGEEPLTLTSDVVDPESLLRTRSSGLKILLAEDNLINQEVALELLSSVGLNVDLAIDGNEAVAKATSTLYDLILMDMQMPDMDGIEAARAILAMPERGNVQILAMTANAFDSDRRACADAGMVDFVTKPVHPATFYATLLKWLPVRVPSVEYAGISAPNAPSNADLTTGPVSTREVPLLDGIDTVAGLVYANGKMPFYLSLLIKFRDRHGPKFLNDLRKAVAEGDHQSLQRYGHSIRGLAGMLGARELATVAGEFETCIRDEEFEHIPELQQRLEREFSRVINSLSVLAGPEVADVKPVAAAETVDPALLNATITKLDYLLATRDTSAGLCVRELNRLLSGRQNNAAALAKLNQSISNFDFSTALQSLRQLADSLDAPLGDA
jgi:CheY-like chemotaxis protein